MAQATGLNQTAISLIWRAYDLRNQTSDRGKFWITTAYETQVTENLEQAREECGLWAETYPATPHLT
jgi:hypothetical protein